MDSIERDTFGGVVTSDGMSLPPVGFGTYRLNGAEGSAAIESAIDLGYRLIDTAFSYDNEGAVGMAVRTADVPRTSVRVSSKLPGRYHRRREAICAVEESLMRAGLDYLDLYLIHWPNPQIGRYVEAWEALIDARDRGLVRSIGVCNFLPDHVDQLERSTGVLPSVNQIEMHPYFPQEAQRAYNESKGIVTEAWSPLGRASALLNDPLLMRLATKHGVDVGRLILRWHAQLGVIPLPKSTSPERQRNNLNLSSFALDADDVAAIATLARPDGRINGQDPATYEEL